MNYVENVFVTTKQLSVLRNNGGANVYRHGIHDQWLFASLAKVHRKWW